MIHIFQNREVKNYITVCKLVFVFLFASNFTFRQSVATISSDDHIAFMSDIRGLRGASYEMRTLVSYVEYLARVDLAGDDIYQESTLIAYNSLLEWISQIDTTELGDRDLCYTASRMMGSRGQNFVALYLLLVGIWPEYQDVVLTSVDFVCQNERFPNIEIFHAEMQVLIDSWNSDEVVVPREEGGELLLYSGTLADYAAEMVLGANGEEVRSSAEDNLNSKS